MSEDIVKESIKCLANMEIEETTYQVARSVVLEEIERLKSIIKEVRELVENGTDFKSIYFEKDKEDLWKVILANEIKEKYLEILDKENK